MTTKKRKLTLSRIEERVQQLPLLPSVVCDLMALDTNSPFFYDKVTELSQADPPLATRVLKIANSASSAHSHVITDLHEALIRVGTDKILSIITTLSVARVFTPVTDQQKAIWQHSIETAHIAKFVAIHLKDINVDKGLAFTSGLLHDIGRFVLFEMTAKAIDVVDAKGWDTPIELPEVEKGVLGFTHADAGFIAAKKWQLPKVIVDMIRYHHNYDISKHNEVSAELRSLVLVVQFADLVSVLIEKNPEWPDWDEAKLTSEIRSFCHHDSWPKVNFPVNELVKELPVISNECYQILEKLRLR
ncbi:HDOD domain-containing protein [Neptuniibacter sp. QD48_55]|uniref:HDOD domain-containing protein n=1 Tax=Neptuniibacter sp. QD48_55 TaxID=3398212 RepID=UPI0039F455D2